MLKHRIPGVGCGGASGPEELAWISGTYSPWRMGALNDLIGRLRDEHWGVETPASMRFRDHHRTLLDLVRHFAYDDAWVPEVLAGKTAGEVGDKFDGDLLGDEPKASFNVLVETAVAAVQGFANFDRVVHLSYGDFPANVYLEHIIIFRGFGTYDIAKLVGDSAELPAGLVHGLWEIIEPQAGELRELGSLGRGCLFRTMRHRRLGCWGSVAAIPPGRCPIGHCGPASGRVRMPA